MDIREPIDVALWNLLANHANVRGKFITTGRFLRHFEDVPREQMPALFMIQKGEAWVRPGTGIPAKRTLKRALVLYASTNVPTEVYPSSLCNAMMDVIDQVLETPGNPSNAQTLGGLCEHVYLEGDVIIEEGLLQDVSILVAPINILLP